MFPNCSLHNIVCTLIFQHNCLHSLLFLKTTLSALPDNLEYSITLKIQSKSCRIKQPNTFLQLTPSSYSPFRPTHPLTLTSHQSTSATTLLFHPYSTIEHRSTHLTIFLFFCNSFTFNIFFCQLKYFRTYVNCFGPRRPSQASVPF